MVFRKNYLLDPRKAGRSGVSEPTSAWREKSCHDLYEDAYQPNCGSPDMFILASRAATKADTKTHRISFTSLSYSTFVIFEPSRNHLPYNVNPPLLPNLQTLQDRYPWRANTACPSTPPRKKTPTYLSGRRRHVHRLELAGRPSTHKLELELPRDLRLLAHQLRQNRRRHRHLIPFLHRRNEEVRTRTAGWGSRTREAVRGQ